MTAHGRKTTPMAGDCEVMAGTLSAGSAFRKAFNSVHEIADGSHGAEVLRRDLLAGDAADAIDEVHRVDAVDLEILVETRRRRDPRRIDLEELGESRAQHLQNLVGAQHANR